MLPQNLNYKGKIEAAAATSFTSSIIPQNGSTADFGNTIIINIPTGNNLCLASSENYLRFTVDNLTNGATAGAYSYDVCGAHSYVERIRLFSSSNLIQDITNYNMLAKLVYSLQIPSDALKGKYNVMNGSRGDTDYVVGEYGTLAANAAIPARTFCLNLISLIGSLGSQYFPLFACTASNLRLEITFVSNVNQALGSFTALTVTTNKLPFNNIEFVANYIKLSDEALSMVYSSLDGKPLQLCVPDWSNYAYNVQLPLTTSTQISVPIPAKFSSLRSIFVGIRKNTGQNLAFPQSSVNFGLSEYFFRLGAECMPSRPVTNLIASYCEAAKAMGSLSDYQFTPTANFNSYTLAQNTDFVNAAAVTATSSGTFFIGIDLESYVNAPKTTIFSGINTNNSDCYAVMTFASPVAVTSARFDTMCLYDSVISFENNSCYRKF